ncbi:MAG: outer membrane protein transport protein [Myxococcales bacterium]
MACSRSSASRPAGPTTWVGNFISTRASLRTFYLNPEVAYGFLGRVRVGVGVQIVRGSVDLRHQVDPKVPGFTTDLEGVDWGVGANAGLQIDILEKGSKYGALSFGASYRSAVTLDFQNAKATFKNVPPPLAPVLKDSPVSAKVTLPQLLQLGVAWSYGGLRLGVDTEYTGWQTIGAISVESTNPALRSTVRKDFHHTWNLHVGGEYAITENWLVRLGFMYDPTPSPSETLAPDLPDADRLNFAGGVGFRMGGFAADVGYQYVLFLNTESTFPELPGTMSGDVHVIGLSLGYSFKL